MVRTAKSKSAPHLKLADHIVHDQTSHPWSHIGFTATKSLWWSYYCLLLLECQRKTVWCMIKLAPRQLSCTPRQRCCLGTQHLITEVSCLALAEQGCRQHSLLAGLLNSTSLSFCSTGCLSPLVQLPSVCSLSLLFLIPWQIFLTPLGIRRGSSVSS